MSRQTADHHRRRADRFRAAATRYQQRANSLTAEAHAHAAAAEATKRQAARAQAEAADLRAGYRSLIRQAEAIERRIAADRNADPDFCAGEPTAWQESRREYPDSPTAAEEWRTA